MANLKDYISGLVASVTIARYNADTQSAEIARQYKSDSILCNFSIPRMRVGDIEIEIPYALDYQKSQEDGLVLDEGRTYRVMRNSLCKSYGISEIPSDEIKTFYKLNDSLEDCAREIIRGIKRDGQAYIEKNIKRLYENYVEIWIECMSNLGVKSILPREEIIKNMHNAVLLSIQNPDLGNLEIIAEAEKLSQFDSRVITRMKIRIQEDGLVWANSANGEILVSE